MAELLRIILSEIDRKGPITFERFMELALYHPVYGYYMRASLPFGPEGDYYTSAHLPLFGETLALQVIELLDVLGTERLTIAEFGPGMGYLAEGILKQIKEEGLLRRVHYILLEKNPFLKERQRETLREFREYVEWMSPEELHPIEGLIINNEVLDALPVHMVQFSGDRFHEVYLTNDNGRLMEVLGPLSNEALEVYIKRYGIPEIEAYRTEINLRARAFLEDLFKCLRRGLVLLIDYGYSARQYYAPERNKGTLLCYHKHRVDEAVYEMPGHKDITAHLNFSAIRDWAEEIGFQVVGYTSQGSFLVGLGIDRLIEERLRKEPNFSRRLPAIKDLIFGMGDTHQVMVLTKAVDQLPAKGFTIRNRLEELL